MLFPGVPLVVPFLGRVVAHHQGVLGELLEEALGCCHVDVEVERPGHGGQGEEGEKRPHFAGDLAGHLVLLVTVEGGGGSSLGRGSGNRQFPAGNTERRVTALAGTQSRPRAKHSKLPRSGKLGPGDWSDHVRSFAMKSWLVFDFCRHATKREFFWAVLAAKIHQKRP